MGKIFYLMGKSSTGKDTIYRMLLSDETLRLKKIVPYTTRPIRAGELNGREYFFIDTKELSELESQGKVIERRSYHTFHGVWEYMTVNDGNWNLQTGNYLMIGTLESFVKTKAYFGEASLVPIYIDLDDGVRLSRALEREKQQSEPKFQEMCRRFLADEEDFSKDKLVQAGIFQHFYNDDLKRCTEEISAYISAMEEK